MKLSKNNIFYSVLRQNVAFFDDGTLNTAYNAVDKHIETGNAKRLALIFENASGKVQTFTFLDLARESNKYANYLTELGVKRGDRVLLFLPRIPPLYFSFLGAMKMGAIVGTLFSTLQQDGLKDRLDESEAVVVLTTKELANKLYPLRKSLPRLKHIIALDDRKCKDEIDAESDIFTTVHTTLSDYAYLVYTSGTTDKPKGIIHTHGAILEQYASFKYVFDMKDNDIYWSIHDPAEITGIVYGILSNWSSGITTVVYEGSVNPARWYEILIKHKITVWYTTPQAIRLLMRKGLALVKKHDLASLRYIVSGGEPLNPQAIIWGKEAFGKYIRDTWCQTETGSIMIANVPGLTVKPGSMGKPLPWVDGYILDDKGKAVAPGVDGNLVLRYPWPSLMQTIWHNKKKYVRYFRHGWYYSGDKARKDADGYFWFVGREDDIIKTEEERVCSFEVESALIEHPAVLEAAVIGKPHAEHDEIIKAFVVLHKDYKASVQLKQNLLEHVRKYVAYHAYPKEIEFIEKLPKTKNGKIMHRILRAKELGEPIGDISMREKP